MYSVHITDIAEEEILTTVKYIADVLKAPMAANNLLDEIEKYENYLKIHQIYFHLYLMNI
jgi:hypothetical protein